MRDHQEVYKTIEVIFWLYYFLHMWKKVEDYVSKCDLCYKIKSSRHRSYKEIRTTLILN